MGWWADWWNSFAQSFGYDEWLWGSAADWFAAVGTVGALFVTLYIVLHDRSRRRADEATALVSWYQFTKRRGDTRLAHIHFHNAGQRPITYIRLMLAINLKSGEYEWIKVNGESQTGLLPGASTVFRVVTTEADPRLVHALVAYFDGAGRRHVRSLRTGAFLSRAEERKATMGSLVGQLRQAANKDDHPIRAGLSSLFRSKN